MKKNKQRVRTIADDVGPGPGPLRAFDFRFLKREVGAEKRRDKSEANYSRDRSGRSKTHARFRCGPRQFRARLRASLLRLHIAILQDPCPAGSTKSILSSLASRPEIEERYVCSCKMSFILHRLYDKSISR